MWSIVLMAVGGLFIGGALSLRQQKAHISWIITAAALAIVSLGAAWALTYSN
ncbi:hypothetical protein [Neomicrococcus aestuarii]|uniref:Lysozyme family protein n=1 Tax=Neomicrococcus aestuarii TaxID=556325 RepID=A0A7W8TRM8_9MICC|nr:hypothetical protein [Neomicrococcus aestuarii]MBB5511644.1 lysozyme family protein [Neomicrococcus aestuarii]